MAWAQDSRYDGWLGPKEPPEPTPIQDDPWDDFLHGMVVGVTGMDPTLVRPRWQKEPPPIPDVDVDWCAFGITRTKADWQAAVVHRPAGDGYDIFQRQEESDLLCSFYGRNPHMWASLLRDGLQIPQNVAILRRNAVAIIEAHEDNVSPELFRQQWRDRIDMTVRIRREIRRNYPVLSLLRARGPITGSTKAGQIIHSQFDTAGYHITVWDIGATLWDNDQTKWDVNA